LLIKEKIEKVALKKLVYLRMDNLALFFFKATDTINIATTRKAIAIDAGSSGTVGEGLRLVGDGEFVDVRLVGDGVVEV
jgi:hypothetical protein